MKGQKKQQVRQQSESIEDIRRREYIERIIPEDIPLSDPIGIIGETFGQGYKDGFRDGAFWMVALVESQCGDTSKSNRRQRMKAKTGKETRDETQRL